VLSILVLAVLVVYGMNAQVLKLIEVQTHKNLRLKEAIKQLNQQVKDTNRLQSQYKTTLARVNKITGVLNHRVDGVHLFDELIRVIPSAVYLTELERTKGLVMVSGSADSNTAISTMMRNIELNPWFHQARLTEIKKVNLVGQSAEYQFKLNFILKRS
jgi:type IV pilus assembly protein PilN